MLTLIHRACGRPALLVDEDAWRSHAVARPEHCLHVDGRKVFLGDPIVCDACGGAIGFGPDSVSPQESTCSP